MPEGLRRSGMPTRVDHQCPDRSVDSDVARRHECHATVQATPDASRCRVADNGARGDTSHDPCTLARATAPPQLCLYVFAAGLVGLRSHLARMPGGQHDCARDRRARRTVVGGVLSSPVSKHRKHNA